VCVMTRRREGGKEDAFKRPRFVVVVGSHEARAIPKRRRRTHDDRFPCCALCALEGGERVLGNKIQTRASASKQAIL